MDLWAAGTKSDTLNVVSVNVVLKAHGKFIESNKEIGRERTALPNSMVGMNSSDGVAIDEDRERWWRCRHKQGQ